MAVMLTSNIFRRLDALCGFPPDAVVEKFQQRLKAIKSIDRYSLLMQAIRFSDTINSSTAMINWIQSSVRLSNSQGYTRIRIGVL